MPKVYKFREIVKILKKYDKRFEIWKNRGKGSERIIYHPDINGESRSFPIKCHSENTEIKIGILKSLIRRFDLPSNLFY